MEDGKNRLLGWSIGMCKVLLGACICLVALVSLTVWAGNAEAAVVTYYGDADNPGINVGVDGATNLTLMTGNTTYNVTVNTTNAYRVYGHIAGPPTTTRSVRYRLSAVGTTATPTEYFRLYTPVYGSAMNIAANVTGNVVAAHGVTSFAAKAIVNLYEYNDSTGLVGGSKGQWSTTLGTLITANTAQSFNGFTIPNALFTVAPGNRVVAIYSMTYTSNRPVYYVAGGFSTSSGHSRIVLNETVCADGDATSGVTITLPTNGSTVTNNYTIKASVAGEGTPGGAGMAAYVTIGGTSACNQTNAAMTWTAGTSTWDYVWNNAACATTAPESAQISVRFYDVDCKNSTTSATTNITLDNICLADGDRTTAFAITLPASSATVKGNYLIQTSITGTETLPGTGLANITIAGSTACNQNAASMTWNGTSGKWEYTWNTAACGTPPTVPDYNITINANYKDPDCAVWRPATQVSSITIDNSDPYKVETCGACHAYPPADAAGGVRNTPMGAVAGSHNAHVDIVGLACTACHINNGAVYAHRTGVINVTSTINSEAGTSYSGGTSFNQINNPTLGTCASINCHGNQTPTWGGIVGCVNCHNVAVPSPVAQGLDATVTSRRAITPEFAQTWSHKRTAGGTVTNNDCGVCHMEGIASTGKTDPAYHRNGYVELRDPDTGTTIQGANWGGTNAGSYTSTGSAQTFVQFKRALNTATLEAAVKAIQINQCLKCHDANGANNANARVPSGTALRPFNTAPTHTPGNNVLDADAHFATTNQSYHPVKGKQNNSYADIDKMFTPWNQVTRTAGTTNTWGDLLSCWDCHAPLNTASTVTLTNTVTAHGGATTLRGYPVATTYATGVPLSGNTSPAVGDRASLCILCHKNYDNSGTNYSHGTNSAFSTDTGRVEKQVFLYYGCNMCHSSSWSVAVTRPTRSVDVHGTNTVPTGLNTKTGRWAGGTKNGPISFIRNSNQFGDHAPLNITGTAYAPVCMDGPSGNSTCTRTGTEAYGAGGVY